MVASCAFGLEVRPDSLSLTVNLMQNRYKVLDTITLHNPSGEQIQIDTVSIKFLNVDSIGLPYLYASLNTSMSM